MSVHVMVNEGINAAGNYEATCLQCPVDYDYRDDFYVQVSGVLVSTFHEGDLEAEFQDAHLDANGNLPADVEFA